MFKTLLLTTLALLAFAGNSVLSRLALNDNVIDAASFTSIRLFSGIVFLLFLVTVSRKTNVDLKKGSWLSSLFLFLYALSFSYAYITLDTGTGALILFGTVQVTMIVYGFIKGNKLQLIEWAGLCIAFLGLIILLLPSATTPSFSGFLLMAISGIAWGFYTLAGKGSTTPLLDTTNNFLRTFPFIIIFLISVMILNLESFQLSKQGVVLAIVSGAISSGLGYAIWYSALAGLSGTQAAIIQLSVPIIAAFGGVIFSNEIITQQLTLSSLLVLGGVFVVIVGKKYFVK